MNAGCLAPVRSRRTPGVRCRQSGVAALETLLAAPVALLLGLSALQWALVFHGRIAVGHAAQEAVRAGSPQSSKLSRVGDRRRQAAQPAA